MKKEKIVNKSSEDVKCPRCEQDVPKESIICPFCGFGIMAYIEGEIDEYGDSVNKEHSKQD